MRDWLQKKKYVDTEIGIWLNDDRTLKTDEEIIEIFHQHEEAFNNFLAYIKGKKEYLPETHIIYYTWGYDNWKGYCSFKYIFDVVGLESDGKPPDMEYKIIWDGYCVNEIYFGTELEPEEKKFMDYSGDERLRAYHDRIEVRASKIKEKGQALPEIRMLLESVRPYRTLYLIYQPDEESKPEAENEKEKVIELGDGWYVKLYYCYVTC